MLDGIATLEPFAADDRNVTGLIDVMRSVRKFLEARVTIWVQPRNEELRLPPGFQVRSNGLYFDEAFSDSFRQRIVDSFAELATVFTSQVPTESGRFVPLDRGTEAAKLVDDVIVQTAKT